MLKVKIEYVKNESSHDLRLAMMRLVQCSNSRIIKTRGDKHPDGVGVITIVTRDLDEVMDAVLDINSVVQYAACVNDVKRVTKIGSLKYKVLFNSCIEETL